jgi:hypothetical protein
VTAAFPHVATGPPVVAAPLRAATVALPLARMTVGSVTTTAATAIGLGAPLTVTVR